MEGGWKMKKEQERTGKADKGEKQETEGNNLAKPPDVFLCNDFRDISWNKDADCSPDKSHR